MENLATKYKAPDLSAIDTGAILTLDGNELDIEESCQ